MSKIIVSHDALYQAISLADKCQGKKSSLPILSNALFDQPTDGVLRIIATDLEIGTISKIPAEGKLDPIVVPIKQMKTFLKKMPKVPITLESDTWEYTLKASAEGIHLNLNCYPTDEYPKPHDELLDDSLFDTQYDANTLDGASFKQSIKRILHAASTDETRPILQTVYIRPSGESLEFVTTDTWRLADIAAKYNCRDDMEPVLVSARGVKFLVQSISNGPVAVAFGDAHMIAKFNNVTAWARYYCGESRTSPVFPNVDNVIQSVTEREGGQSVVADREKLQCLIGRLKNAWGSKASHIYLNIGPGELSAEINDVDVGGVSGSLGGIEFEGEPFKIAFIDYQLLDAIESFDVERIQFQFDGSDKPVLIQGADPNDTGYIYLLMPLRED